MFLKTIATAAFFATGLATTLPAMTVGQPFLTAENDLTGSLLDYFDAGMPSGVKQINVSGTITEEIGAPGLVGKKLAFRSNLSDFTNAAEFTLGSTIIDGFGIFDGSVGTSYDYEPFQSGPGDLNLTFFVFPPILSDTPNADDPGLFDFVYGGDFSEFPDKIGTAFPEIQLMMSIYLDGPLPTRTFEEFDPITNELVDSFDFIEGDLAISRITLGLVGGDPIAPIPLPAGLPLLLGGLGLLTFLRRRQN